MSVVGLIEVELLRVEQLFNPLDPSPPAERDLAREIEEFIESWAREQHADAPLILRIHLREDPGPPERRELAAHAVRRYFRYRADLTERERRELRRQGRGTLAIGLPFLAACVAAGQLLAGPAGPTLGPILRESLLVGGWVAMWKPLEIHLYDHLPLRRRLRIQRRLADAEVEWFLKN
jgi:hypothetical protein